VKLYAITMAFCRAALLRHSLPKLRSLMTLRNVEHWVTLNHWPIDDAKNTYELSMIAMGNSCRVYDQGYDRGLQKAFNKWFYANVENFDSIIFGIDPDTCASPGFDAAILDVMTHDPAIKVCGLWNAGNQCKLDRGEPLPEMLATKTGTRYFIHLGVEMWDVIGIRSDWIKEIGGLGQLHEYYGNLELYLHAKPGFKLAYLIDYKQEPGNYPDECFDPRYRIWKDAHLAGFKGSFGEWLRNHTI